MFDEPADKIIYFAILSEAKNLSSVWAPEKKERFFASLRMTIILGSFSAAS
jgi:hypothetical protein